MKYERRCREMVLNCLVDCPETWALWTGQESVGIRSILNKAETYISAYQLHPPFETQDPVGVGTYGPVFLPVRHIPSELWEAASSCEGVWPAGQNILFCDFVEMAYPMILYQDHAHMVVALNSCRAPADNISSSAFGYLGEKQMRSLKDLLDRNRDKQAVILLHHHVGLPIEVKKTLLRSFSRLELKALQLRDAKALVALLKRRPRPTILFHGHKHVAYVARTDQVIVVSAPSVAYGDLLGGGSVCTVYGIDRQGVLSVIRKSGTGS
ncbi:MAG: metallophosphoesterase family protein [Candidatus Binataceae bacterium]